MEEILDLKTKIDKLKLKNQILKNKIKSVTFEDTEIILKLDKKIFDLREENQMLKAKLMFVEAQLEELKI